MGVEPQLEECGEGSTTMSLRTALVVVWSTIAMALAIRVVTGSEVWSGIALVAVAFAVGAWRAVDRAARRGRRDGEI